MKLKISAWIFAALATLVVLMGSCKIDGDEIGLNIQPPGDELKLAITDTITAVAFSVREDSVRTDKLPTSLLGSYYDPVFGKTTASLYTEMLLSNILLDFGEGAVIDSVVLSLAYQNIWGDTASYQTFRVFELTDSLNIDSAYFSNRTHSYDHINELGSVTVIPTTDSVLMDTVKVAPHLRIPLSQALASKFLGANPDVYSSNTSFRQFFKGLFITADPVDEAGKGALSTFSLLAENTNLRIYYQNDENDSLTYTFYITSGAARYSHYEHYDYEHASPEFRQQVIEGDTSLGSDILYMQPLGGVKTYLHFPGLAALGSQIGENENMAVNEAQIFFSLFDPEPALDPPPRLVLAKLTNDEGSTTLLDDQREGEVYFGGFYNKENKEYMFRLNRYVQQRLLDPEGEDFGLALLIPGASSVPQRVLLNGSAAENGRIRIIIKHTNF